jgi:hypothetical protein
MNDQISTYFDYTPTELSAAVIVFNLIATLVLSLIIVFIYRRTRHGLSYSQSFVFTLVMMGILGTMVMMVIQNNLVGAFALLGAFTLIRFRTILKETSDVAFIFFALITGIAIGLGHYTVAGITVFFLGTVILVMHKFAFGSVSDNFDYLLVLRAKKGFQLNTIEGTLNEYVGHRDVISTKTLQNETNEFVFSLKLKSGGSSVSLHEALSKVDSIEGIELLTGKNTTEY